MANVWVLYGEDGETLGTFSTREKAEAVISPSILGTGRYSLEEAAVDVSAGEAGEVYGQVYTAEIDLDSGENCDPDPFAYCVFRREDMPDGASVSIGRDSSSVFGRSTTSHEAALAAARRVREDYLASDQPTRQPTEMVQLEGDVTHIYGKSYKWKPRPVYPGVGSLHVPFPRPEGSFGQLVFRRTERRTEGGLAIFALEPQPS